MAVTIPAVSLEIVWQFVVQLTVERGLVLLGCL
jgi:hypothetical protein